MTIIYKQPSKLANLTLVLPLGSSTENIVTNGATHFLEHLFFRNRESLTQEAELNAIEWNAWTTKDALYLNALTIPENKEIMLKEAKELLKLKNITPQTICEEKRHILEENEQTSNHPLTAMMDFISASCYSGPYSMPIIGSRHNILNMNTSILEEIKEDLDASDLFIFTNFKSPGFDDPIFTRKSTKSKVAADSRFAPQIEEAFYLRSGSDLTQSHVAISLHGGSWSDPKLGERLLLNQIIFFNLENLASNVSVQPFSSIMKSDSSFFGSMLTGKIDDLQKILQRNIKTLGNIDEDELDELKEQITYALQEENIGYFDSIEYMVHEHINGFDREQLFESIRNTSKSDIDQLLDQYVKDHQIAVHILHETPDKPDRPLGYRFDIASGRITTDNKI